MHFTFDEASAQSAYVRWEGKGSALVSRPFLMKCSRPFSCPPQASWNFLGN